MAVKAETISEMSIDLVLNDQATRQLGDAVKDAAKKTDQLTDATNRQSTAQKKAETATRDATRHTAVYSLEAFKAEKKLRDFEGVVGRAASTLGTGGAGKYSDAISQATMGTADFIAALTTGGIWLAGAAAGVTLLTTAFGYFSSAANEAAEKQKKLNDELLATVMGGFSEASKAAAYLAELQQDLTPAQKKLAEVSAETEASENKIAEYKARQVELMARSNDLQARGVADIAQYSDLLQQAGELKARETNEQMRLTQLREAEAIYTKAITVEAEKQSKLKANLLGKQETARKAVLGSTTAPTAWEQTLAEIDAHLNGPAMSAAAYGQAVNELDAAFKRIDASASQAFASIIQPTDELSIMRQELEALTDTQREWGEVGTQAAGMFAGAVGDAFVQLGAGEFELNKMVGGFLASLGRTAAAQGTYYLIQAAALALNPGMAAIMGVAPFVGPAALATHGAALLAFGASIGAAGGFIGKGGETSTKQPSNSNPTQDFGRQDRERAGSAFSGINRGGGEAVVQNVYISFGRTFATQAQVGRDIRAALEAAGRLA